MKNFLAVVIVVCMASFVMAQPPKGDNGSQIIKKGPPTFQTYEHMQRRMEMMKRSRGEDRPDVQRRPVPPPWAGRPGVRRSVPPQMQEMMQKRMQMMQQFHAHQRGVGGPQHPFQGQRPDFRRGGPKAEVSGHHHGHRGQGWQHRGHKSENKWSGAKKQNHRGHTKKCGCKSCPCKNCHNKK